MRSFELFRNSESKESIVIERAGPAEQKGVNLTTKSLIICRRLSEGLRDVERIRTLGFWPQLPTPHLSDRDPYLRLHEG